MKYFLDKDYFTSTVEYNYQALCPTEIVCVTDGASDLPRIFVVHFFHSLMSILQTLNQSLFALFALVLTNQVPVSESVSEYTNQVLKVFIVVQPKLNIGSGKLMLLIKSKIVLNLVVRALMTILLAHVAIFIRIS